MAKAKKSPQTRPYIVTPPGSGRMLITANSREEAWEKGCTRAEELRRRRMANNPERKFMESPTGETTIVLHERPDPENSTFRHHVITTVHNNPQTWAVELYVEREQVMTVLEKIAGWKRLT